MPRKKSIQYLQYLKKTQNNITEKIRHNIGTGSNKKNEIENIKLAGECKKEIRRIEKGK